MMHVTWERDQTAMLVNMLAGEKIKQLEMCGTIPLAWGLSLHHHHTWVSCRLYSLPVLVSVSNKVRIRSFGSHPLAGATST